MKREEYNGWTNWETWCTNLWLSKEEGLYREWMEQTASHLKDADNDADKATGSLATTMRDRFMEDVPETVGLFTDFVVGSLREVNWEELARHMVDEVEV